MNLNETNANDSWMGEPLGSHEMELTGGHGPLAPLPNNTTELSMATALSVNETLARVTRQGLTVCLDSAGLLKVRGQPDGEEGTTGQDLTEALRTHQAGITGRCQELFEQEELDRTTDYSVVMPPPAMPEMLTELVLEALGGGMAYPMVLASGVSLDLGARVLALAALYATGHRTPQCLAGLWEAYGTSLAGHLN